MFAEQSTFLAHAIPALISASIIGSLYIPENLEFMRKRKTRKTRGEGPGVGEMPRLPDSETAEASRPRQGAKAKTKAKTKAQAKHHRSRETKSEGTTTWRYGMDPRKRKQREAPKKAAQDFHPTTPFREEFMSGTKAKTGHSRRERVAW